MTLTRRLARPMLAATFISGGINTLRNPAPRVALAEPVTTKLAGRLPLPEDTEQLVKINAAVQVGAGVLLATGRVPRLAATALAASVVPTTLAGHRFWELDDPAKRVQQQTHFFKNVGLLGGLILAMVDTEGAPSLRWRARRAAKRTKTVASAASHALPIG